VLIRLNGIIFCVLEVIPDHIQLLPLLECHLLSLPHYAVDVSYLLMHLAKRFLLFPKQSTLQLVIKPLHYFLFLLRLSGTVHPY
jgi:hypothetical protein